MVSKALEKTVSSTAFQNQAGLYIEQAATAPVFITKYHRPARVLLDIAEYERLQARAKARPTRRAFKAEAIPSDAVRAIEAADYGHIDPELDKLMD